MQKKQLVARNELNAFRLIVEKCILRQVQNDNTKIVACIKLPE